MRIALHPVAYHLTILNITELQSLKSCDKLTYNYSISNGM
jgi:hypothetical protein